MTRFIDVIPNCFRVSRFFATNSQRLRKQEFFIRRIFYHCRRCSIFHRRVILSQFLQSSFHFLDTSSTCHTPTLRIEEKEKNVVENLET